MGAEAGLRRCCSCRYDAALMSLYDKIPAWLKATIGFGVMLIGPVMVGAFWVWGTTGGIVAVLSIIVFFTFIYIVGVRRYIER
jgi:hypothetical protein